MNLYRYSPIKDEKSFAETVEYITGELEKLAVQLVDQKLPITTLKIFAHYPEEYKYLYHHISNRGPKASFSSDTSYYVKVNEQIKGYSIQYLGVRIVDPYRMQVGCGDYEIDNFSEFKKKHLNTSPFIRNFSEEMIEVWHPDFDILGYIVPKL